MGEDVTHVFILANPIPTSFREISKRTLDLPLSMSFTFGGLNNHSLHMLKRVDVSVLSLSPRNQLQIKNELHALFSTTVLSNIIGDYILGCALLNLDIFNRNSIRITEIYSLLYSVACCHECTIEIFNILSQRKAYVMRQYGIRDPLEGFHVSQLPSLDTLMSRYYFMKNKRTYNYVSQRSPIYPDRPVLVSRYGVWDSPAGNASLYFIKERFNGDMMRESVVRDIASLLESCGIGILRENDSYSRVIQTISPITIMRAIAKAALDGWGMDSGKALCMLRRQNPSPGYYSDLRCLPDNEKRDLLLTMRSRSGLEDAIMVCLKICMDIRDGVSRMSLFVSLYNLWTPLRIILQRCKITEEGRDRQALQKCVIYKNMKHSVSLFMNEVEERTIPFYTYSNGISIPYVNLLHFIAYHFVFTEDRDYILQCIETSLSNEDEPQYRNTFENDRIQCLLTSTGSSSCREIPS